jgi:ATP-binding protein involved in chromosome partitioning
MPMPVEIVALNRPEMTITWEDGHTSVWPARDLRLRCRCAMCIEEMTGQKILDPANVPEDVRVADVQLMGQYAIVIAFSDGHATGIYRFRDLREECPCEACQAARSSRS